MPVQCTPYPDNVNYEKQSIIVPGTKQPGQTAHYRNALFGLVDANGAGVLTTLPEVFNNGFALDPDARLFGHRPLLSKAPLKFGPYVWQTYREVDVRRRRIGSALHRMFNTGKLKAADLESVGIWSQNRPEWQLVDLALQAYGKVGVSLYDTLGKDSVGKDSINHAQLSIVFTTADHIAALLRLSAKIPSLKVIVSFDSLDDGVRSVLSSWAESLGIRIMHLSEVEHYGEEYLIEPFAASPDQIANLCYTSGTTNNPKGVILTHGNLASAVYSLMFGAHFPTSCCLISYLPLAHIYERIIELTIMSIGGCVGYFTGDPLRLMEDAQALKPHLFPAVPRVLNRVYQAAMAAGDVPGLKGAIFRTALQTKLDQLRKTGVKTHALWDTLVFRKIRAVLGGNVTALFTGSAPISGEVIDFLKIAFGCEVLEGYGMTENCGVCSHTIDGDATGAGTIGPPNPVIEIKLVDIPAMNYLSTDKPNPRGELCVRGPNCFQGYYKDEKTTQETIKDGWTHTGDVAEIDKYGRFKIIDRVKNIMKLSQGEYVALEKVENTYNASPIVQQLYVHGDALQSYLVAVIVPDPLVLAPVVSAILGRKVEPTDNLALVEAVKDPRVVQEVLNLLNAEAKKKKLAGFEMIKRIHLTMDPFTVEENTLTPTFKLRRRDAYAKFKKELDALYALGEPTNGLSFKL
ncbi:hypothetical protein SCLCIDRAFT_1219315 [Scleroderma citrinum Foug A]|uniref:AMP-dependent synthetase/ligase domain-containing protein n=1 Tax=Scleroderma citrinum Foug A TaxID=1036808 RepID=A0A0C3DA89_9AGAM|nr:hypothetical protein SCLCIDRAFT_1219315 [Scleroderma citrinum Foug A]